MNQTTDLQRDALIFKITHTRDECWLLSNDATCHL